MVRVLLTGAFGYIGLAVLARLGERYEWVAYGHPPRTDAARAIGAGRARVIEGDVVDIEQHRETIGGVDAVVHLAGGGGPARVEADPVAAVRGNVTGTAAVAAAARAAGARRLVMASTIQVYGTRRGLDRPYREEDGPAPDDLYGAVKEAAERVWLAAGGHVLRLANVYGTGSGADVGLDGAVERFARAAASGGTITVYGDGAQRIDYVHVDDVVDAFDRALRAPAPPAVVNIGGGAPVAIGDLARRFCDAGRALGAAPRIERRPAPPGKLWPDRSLDITRARDALGWRPRVPLERGIEQLVAAARPG